MCSVGARANGQRPRYYYGDGREINYLDDHGIVEYEGNWWGFQAVMPRYTDERLTVIPFTNLALCRTERLGHTVAGLVDPVLEPYPDGIADQAPRLTKNCERLMSDTRDANAALLPSGLLASIPVHTLRRDLAELGPILHFALVSHHDTPEGRVRVYRVEGKDMVEFYTVTCGAESKIFDRDLFQSF